MHFKFVFYFLVASALPLKAAVLGPPCPIENANKQQIIKFLLSARSCSPATAECITVAIQKLKNAQSIEEIEILADYLDFRRPPREEEKAGLALRLQVTGELYHAAGQLFLIGRPALPALIQVIGNGKSSVLAHENAVDTLMQIYRNEPLEGVKFLLEQSTKAADVYIGIRLRQSASEAARLCGSTARPQCESLLSRP